MDNHYASFLDYRAAQRRLAAKFARPRDLLIHTLIFVTVMTATWVYGLVWQLWRFQENFFLPVIIGVFWSVLLALHALHHYRRSAAITERRDLAVEEEMRAFVAQDLDDATLFALHRNFEADLERQSRWSLPLLAFACVNVVSWLVSALDVGSSWPFQMTLPFAVVIIGGLMVLLNWQQQRQSEQRGWFTRLPLRHIAAYLIGAFGLALASMYRLINDWDATNLIQLWGIALVIHIIAAVIVAPLLTRKPQPIKREASVRLVLADDGEVIEVFDQESEQKQAVLR